MDRNAANEILGKPQYQIIYEDSKRAGYRDIIRTESQTEFNVQNWRPSEKWKIKHEKKDDLESDQIGSLTNDIIEFPTILLGLLIGSKRSHLLSVEKNYNVKITILNEELDKTNIRISSENSYTDVQEAINYINKFIEEKTKARLISPLTRKNLITHFICLPVYDDGFLNQMNNFKNQVLRKKSLSSSYPQLNESYFQKPDRAHLTLCVLSLTTESIIDKAVEIFNNLQNKIYEAVDTRTLSLEFIGVHALTDSNNDSVLVTQPHRIDINVLSRIKSLMSVLVNALVEGKIITWDDLHEQRLIESDNNTINLKIHITLLNTKYSHKNNIKYNFSELIKDYSFIKFGKIYFNEIQFCSIKKTSSAYSILGHLNLP